MARGIVGGLIALVSAVLVACSLSPGAGTRTDGQQGIPPIVGRVVMSELYGIAATSMADVANGATVSLIDANTNNTVAATVATAQGGFVLSFSGGFLPGAQPYYLEAVKGLGKNIAGNPAARVRTLAFFEGGWSTLTGGDIVVSRGTTALSVMLSHKLAAGEAIDTRALLGSVGSSGAPPPFDPKTSGLSVAEFGTVFGYIVKSLGADADPLSIITYDRGAKSFDIKLPDVPRVFLLVPNLFSEGEKITVRGQNFGASVAGNTLSLGGKTAQITGATSTELLAIVPVGTTSGLAVVSTPTGNSNAVPYSVLPAMEGSVQSP
ncbi:MAG: IPT/TIG domain-containing protein [Candidatus Sericytochromatia bacterium]|uniref:IPT/TIG domain-containing protein n=1 Tax=Candidatus Tanganyikabacteria bacterium TaxID=2961651 RepID=A0A937X069_9BACT|nr:IPT/TIG domain-containing protein [Candidatus Tanganyikabacteria bacterium]